jgi:peptidoglycan/LPS O-acetylase OafA/YrhL
MNLKNIFHLDFDQNRIFGLDLLRMIAILLVVVSHSLSFMPGRISLLLDRFLLDGVGIFFVLSGFLIGKILIQTFEKTSFEWVDIKVFLFKRWSRTLPNYYFFLFLLAIINYQTVTRIGNNFYSYFFFLQNIDHNPQYFFGWSWSLSVEEWFYILIVFLIWVLSYVFSKKKKKHIILGAIFFLIAIPNVFRFFYCVNNGYSSKTFDILQYSVIYRLDTIIYGVLGAFLSYYYSAFWQNKKKIFLISGIILSVVMVCLNLQKYHENYKIFSCLLLFPLSSINVLLYLPFLNDYKKSRLTIAKPITYISLVSYSLYLINGLVADLLIEVWQNQEFIFSKLEIRLKKEYLGILLFCSFWTVSVIWSILQYKFFEVKATDYLRRFLQKNIS